MTGRVLDSQGAVLETGLPTVGKAWAWVRTNCPDRAACRVEQDPYVPPPPPPAPPPRPGARERPDLANDQELAVALDELASELLTDGYPQDSVLLFEAAKRSRGH